MFSSVFVLGCNPQQQGQTSVNQETDPLPSWTDAEAKQRIIQFVLSSVDSSHESFVPLSERIAVFDNDGTLWGEQPFYFQLAFAFDRVKTMAAQHPEWKGKEPFKSVLKGDLNAVMAGGEKSLVQIIAATHSNIPHQVFEESVKGWTDTAKHPVSGRRYIDMVYQPMLELLKYLRSNGYTTWIVSGGGIDFIRAWSEKVYGIPPAQVIGSSIKAAYAFKNGKPEITKLPQLAFVDDGPGKPVGIYQHIGKVPVIAVGNSDGDYEMLQYTTTSGEYKRLGLFIHHTDNGREVAYDSLSHIGKLKRGLTDASSNGWLLVDMKKDWKSVYPE
ncbi:MAG: haloacid dehalogenase-like hydrolase [Chitinophagaceae bacterium]|nr:haloacid dehalogenase-like hydrolase [Chitinophagaceae bacterium]